MSTAKVFEALADVGYSGVCSFEYERDFDNNLGGLAESVGYARGVCDAIRHTNQDFLHLMTPRLSLDFRR